NLFIADTKNHGIRKIVTTSPATITTIAGTTQPGYVDGSLAPAQFKEPHGIAIAGAIYIADTQNDALRLLYATVSFGAVVPKQGSTSGGNIVRVLGTGFVAGAT